MSGFYVFIIGLGIFFLGIYLLKNSINLQKDIDESKDWPATKGMILESKIICSKLIAGNRASNRYEVNLVYEYSVDSKKFRGNKPFLYSLTKKEEAEYIEKNFYVGKIVDVYYKPSVPKNSVLIVGGRNEKKYHEVILSVIVIMVGAGIGILKWGEF